MPLFRSRFIVVISIGVIAALSILAIMLEHPQTAVSDTTTALAGYAWSDTIGWISMNCAQTGSNTCATSNYNITMNANGTLSGYAWSDTLGWISANETTGCPSGTCTPSVQSGKLSGWLRACGGQNDTTTSPTNQSVPNNTCTGWTRTDGWDGWISLSGTSGSVTWGVTYNSSTGAFGSYAWGSSVVGWVDFSQVHAAQCLAATYCKNSQQVCVVDPNTCAETCSTCQFTCQSGACYFPATSGTFTAVPSVVKIGGTATISWNIQNVKNCSVKGDNGDGPWNKGAGADSSVVDSHVSSPIQKQTTYTLDCLELDSQTHYIKNLTVDVVPAFKEI